MSEKKPNLFEQIGGEPAVAILIDDFYDRILADEVLAPFFAETSMEKQRNMQKTFFAAALGGPVGYAGMDLAVAHQGRGITSKHLSRFTEHLIDTLKQGGVEDFQVNEVIARISTYSRVILGEANVDG